MRRLSPRRATTTTQHHPARALAELAQQLKVGDLVFIRVDAMLFRKVASTTGSWTNHVGIVVDVTGPDPVIAESTVPLSRMATLSKFVARSEQGRVCVLRLPMALDSQQEQAIINAARCRMGIWYDTGFNLHSGQQFCSRFVCDVLQEAIGLQPGQMESFAGLLNHQSQRDLLFWRIWYLGRIPWHRQTITPASILRNRELQYWFDGYAA